MHSILLSLLFSLIVAPPLLAQTVSTSTRYPGWSVYWVHTTTTAYFTIHYGSGLPEGPYQLRRVNDSPIVGFFRSGTSDGEQTFTGPTYSLNDRGMSGTFLLDDLQTGIYVVNTNNGLRYYPTGGGQLMGVEGTVDGTYPCCPPPYPRPTTNGTLTLDFYVGGAPTPTPTPTPGTNTTDDDKKDGGNQCGDQPAMARYSVHSMLVSLNIEDRPLRYTPPRGPATDFIVTYNQKGALSNPRRSPIATWARSGLSIGSPP